MGCKVKWALESISMNKASGGDGIPLELSQILKDDAVKELHSICQQIWKTAMATGLENVSFHFNPKERQCQRIFKLPHNCTHLTCQQSNDPNSPSEAPTAHEMRTSRCSSWIQKMQKEPEIKLPTSVGSQKKQESSRKTSTSVSLTMLKPLTVWITTNCGKFLETEISDHVTCLL